MKKKILITGANGYIGKYFFSLVSSINVYEIHLAVRFPVNLKCSNCFVHVLGDFSENPNWGTVLNGVDVVIHIAGFAHAKEKSRKRLELLHYKNNYHATNLLVEAAVKSGVKKFIFLSSIGVNGNDSGNKKIKFSDVVNPLEAYSISKLRAEQSLIQACASGKMSYVIIRPPIVYGPLAHGNMRFLINIIKYIRFLPILKCNNKRSLIYVGNLASLILSCIENNKADNKIFLASDDLDLSISEVIRLLAKGNNFKLCIFPLPVYFLHFALRVTLLDKNFKKFLNPLQIDIEYTKSTLDWRPPFRATEKLLEVR